MKEEVKDLWVDALRSGKYKQGKGQLKDSQNRFCCLGVLCDISEQGEWNSIRYDGSLARLPEAVQDWAEMKTSFGMFSTQDGTSLDFLNDEGFSFREIADIIEKHWKNL